MSLKAKQKKYLKKLSQKDITTLQIGKEGINPQLINHINEVLESKELIKIKILDTDIYPLKETVEEVIQKTNSDIIRTIGKTFIIYRESSELEDDEKINLPK
jgi:RNA-binding protein